jgi:hypothetical protein
VRIACLLFLLAATNTAAATEVLIRGAEVHTVASQGTLKSADVLVRDGKISAVGAALVASRDAEVIEAHGRPLTPGLFAGLTTIGLEEVSGEPSTVDSSVGFAAPAWQQQWRPEFDVTLAYDPRSSVIPVTRIEGTTWALLSPHSRDSIMNGEGAAVVLDGRMDAVLDGSRSLYVRLGEDGKSASGGSRAAQYMLLQQAFREASSSGPADAGSLLHPAGRTELARFLKGGRVLFDVERAADILRVTRFARANGIRPVIVGGSEAWLVAAQLARENVPVILDPLSDLPATFDMLGARLDNAALLHSAGVRIAFTSGDTHNARNVRQLAGNAVAHGLPWSAALEAITSAPADIFGIGATRGRIVPGQSADLVLWSADPLEITSIADRVWISGQPVEMRSRQTDLRDRYLVRVKASSRPDTAQLSGSDTARASGPDATQASASR